MGTDIRDVASLADRLAGWGLSRSIVAAWLVFAVGALCATELSAIGGMLTATVGGIVVGLGAVAAFESRLNGSADRVVRRERSIWWHWVFVVVLVAGYFLGHVEHGRAIRIASVAVVFVARSILSPPRGPLVPSVAVLAIASILFDGLLSQMPQLTLYPLYVLVLMLLLAYEVGLAHAQRGIVCAWLLVLQILTLVLVGLSVTGWMWLRSDLFDTSALRAWIGSLPFAISPSIHSNRMAGTVVCLVPVLATLATGRLYRGRSWGRVKTAATVVVFAALVALVVLTQSRAAIAAAAVVCAALVAMLVGRYRLGWTIVAVSYLMLVLLFVFDLFTPMVQMAGVASNPAVTLNSYTSRQCFWDLGFTVLREHSPSGIGVYTFDAVASVDFPEQYAHCAAVAWTPRLYDVHDQYLQTAIDFGVVGYMAFIALTASIFRMAWRAHRRANDSATRTLVLGLTVGLVAQHIFWLTHVTRLSSRYALFVWITSAMLAGLYHHIVERGHGTVP